MRVLDRSEQFRQLARLAEIRRDAESAQLEQLRTRLRAIELQIAQLEGLAVEDLADTQSPSAFQMSGRERVWDVWRSSRQRELSLQAATARADIERQLQDVRRAFGRHQVLDSLTDRLQAAALYQAKKG